MTLIFRNTAICLGCVSCITELELDMPDTEAVTIVNSIFTNDDDSLKVHVSSSMGINATDVVLPVVNGVQLQDLTTGGQFDLHRLDSVTFFLKNNSALWKGHSYKLTVDTEDGILEAATSIPEPARIIRSTRHDAGIDEYGGPIREYAITLEDIKNEDNYYELFFFSFSNSYYQHKVASYRPNFCLQYMDPVVEAEGLEGYENLTLLFNDNLFKDTTRTLKFRYYACTTSFVPFFPVPSSPDAYAALLTCSKEYYTLRRSWVIHKYHQQTRPPLLSEDFYFEEIRDFLFKGDVQSLDSNIEGGRGIFAGYSIDIIKIEDL